MARQYSSVAVATTLSSTIVAGTTSITVGSVTGWPTSYPYTIIIDPDVAGEEVCTVTAAVGTTLTVTRGVDGSTAAGHNSGAVVKHGVSARDFSEPQVHIDATVAHGATGAVVGTTNTQTLISKTIDAGSNTITNIANANIAAAAAIDKTKISGTAITAGDTGTVTNTMLAGSIANAKLTNSSVTIGGATATLGGSNVTSVTGMVLDATSTVGGVTGTSLAADRTAWTTWTPTFTNLTSATGYFAYKQIGKTVFFRIYISGGTCANGAAITMTLPAGMTAITGPSQTLYGNNTLCPQVVASGGTTFIATGFAANGYNISASATPFFGVIEVQ